MRFHAVIRNFTLGCAIVVIYFANNLDRRTYRKVARICEVSDT